MRPVATYNVVASVPARLERLRDLAYNIHWSWDHEALNLFRRISEELWDETGHNPVRLLGQVSPQRFAELLDDDGFMASYERALENLDEYLEQGRKAWYPQHYGQEPKPCIAYFSFEFGLTESIPNYSGGLGVLAGDHLKAASDLNVPLVGIGLLYQQGYFRQYLNNEGWQQELYPTNDFYTMPLRLATDDDGQPLKISVDLLGVPTYAQIWRVEVGRVTLYLLDTNIPDNPRPAEQNLTDQLYGGDREMRIRQEILLGVGGLRALHAVGMAPEVCHMNEGHAAFMALERARLLMEAEGISFAEAQVITSASNIFTTHTPVPAGNDYFAPELMRRYLSPYWMTLGLNERQFMALGRFDANNNEEYFCMTILALRMSAYANGVSQLHGRIAREMWQNVYPGVPLDEVPIGAITNGVHTFSWVSREMASLYDRYLGPRWRDDPSDEQVWRRAEGIPSEELWRTHIRRRERVVSYARERLVRQLENRGAPATAIAAAQEALDPDVLTIGFARRFATYKRATLLLRDPDRLLRLLNSDQPIQFIFAGKAHPHDQAGKEFIRQIVDFAYQNNCQNRLIFLEDYDMVTTRYMVQGCDVWLNTPRRPLEASGTSGMKAILNGTLNLSILDGWWAEAYRRSYGWAIGRGEEYGTDQYAAQDEIEGNAIYDMLEKDLIPTFYDRSSDDVPRGWVSKMKQGLMRMAPYFSTARMVQEYTTHMYHPALSHARTLAGDGYARGKALATWQKELQATWEAVKIGQVTGQNSGEVTVDQRLQAEAHVHLGGIDPESVSVELYEGPIDTEGQIDRAESHRMALLENGAEPGWYRYTVEYTCRSTGRHGFSVRVVPRHADIDHVLRLGLITWAE